MDGCVGVSVHPSHVSVPHSVQNSVPPHLYTVKHILDVVRVCRAGKVRVYGLALLPVEREELAADEGRRGLERRALLVVVEAYAEVCLAYLVCEEVLLVEEEDDGRVLEVARCAARPRRTAGT